jgi:hypothetical protein
MVRVPAMPHATSNQPALPICRAISAGTMKIPEPIMAPTTSMMESNKPNSREKLRGPLWMLRAVVWSVDSVKGTQP